MLLLFSMSFVSNTDKMKMIKTLNLESEWIKYRAKIEFNDHDLVESAC